MYRLILAFFIISFCITQAAHAALLTNINGVAMVNKGNGFKAVATATEVGPGDRVMSARDGSAQVIFKDGCKFSLKPGQVLSISEKSPCADPSKKAKHLDFSSRMGATEDGPEAAAEPIDPVVVLGGLAVVGGVVGLAVALSNNDDDAPPAPASP